MKQFIFYILFSFTSTVLAQNTDTIKIIRGLVFDMEYQKPLPGVTIRVKGTINQAITDIEGKFELQVSKNQDIILLWQSCFTEIQKRVEVENEEMIYFFSNEHNPAKNQKQIRKKYFRLIKSKNTKTYSNENTLHR